MIPAAWFDVGDVAALLAACSMATAIVYGRRG